MIVSTQEKQEAGDHGRPEKEITVTVNTSYQVTFADNKATGAEIKAAAIKQGVPNIAPDFLVYELKGADNQKQVDDVEEVTLHRNQEFRIIADDDDS